MDGNKQIKIGSILTYVTIGLQVFLGLVYTPFLTYMLGQSEFGLYSLVTSIISYITLLDFGISQAVIVYTAKAIEKKNKDTEYILYGTFLIFYIIIGIISIACGCFLVNNVDIVFSSSMTPEEIDTARILLIILTVNVSCTFFFSIFNNIIVAHERFIFNQLLNIARYALQPIIMIPLLMLGCKSVALVLVVTGINIGILLANSIYCFCNIKISIKFKRLDNRYLLEIAGFSIFVFLGDLVEKVNTFADNIILGIVCGTMAVAVYAVAMQFVAIYRSLSLALSGVLLPRTSKMETSKASNKDFSLLFIKTGRLQYIVLGLVLSGFILFGRQIIVFMFGVDYQDAYVVACVIMIPITIPHIQTVGINILLSKNKNQFRTLVYTIVAIINIVLSIFLSKCYGAIGASIGTGLSYFLGNFIIMNIYYYKKIHLDIKGF